MSSSNAKEHLPIEQRLVPAYARDIGGNLKILLERIDGVA